MGFGRDILTVIDRGKDPGSVGALTGVFALFGHDKAPAARWRASGSDRIEEALRGPASAA